MGTKLNPGKFDCYAAAAEDEPLFVLLARDKHAVALIWLWCTLRELDGENTEKINEARVVAAQMMEWAYNHNKMVVGVGQAALAATFELIRAANYSVINSTNTPTDIDAMRLFLTKTHFEKDPKPLSEV